MYIWWGAVPFVLRRVDGVNGETIYKLVREGYIYRFMYGEALAFKHIQERELSII